MFGDDPLQAQLAWLGIECQATSDLMIAVQQWRAGIG